MNCRILVTVNPFAFPSASANRLASLIYGLSNLGCELEVLILSGYYNTAESSKFGREGVINNVKYKYLNYLINDNIWKLRFQKYLFHFLFSNIIKKRLRKHLLNFNGIIWVENDYTIWEYAFKFVTTRTKLFSDITEFSDIAQRENSSLIHRIFDSKSRFIIEKKILKNTAGISLITHTLIDYYKASFNTLPEILHLPMTVDFDRFENVKSEEKPIEFIQPYIAFIGVMNDAKDGVSILIKAFNLIKDQFPLHRLYLIGGYNYDTPNHLALIKSLGLQDRIFWMNEYPREVIPSIICSADLLALPRPDSKQAQGGFPTKLGEYLASGKPVCATSVGEIPNYLTDNYSVFFADPDSEVSFAEAMMRALSDSENAKAVGLNGKKVALEKFNSDIQARTLYKFLNQLFEN